MSSVVFFDLDGVIIKEQTQLLLIKYLFKKRKINFLLFIKVVGWFILYKLNLVKDVFKIRKKIFRQFKGWKSAESKKLLEDFFEKELKKRINSHVVSLIEKHKEKKEEVILVSASLKEIVDMVKSYLHLKFAISTELEIENGEYTGNIKGLIPYGENKVKIIQDFLDREGYRLNDAWAYSDHISDRKLLEIVGHPCVINPDRKLKKLAKKKGWKIYEFR